MRRTFLPEIARLWAALDPNSRNRVIDVDHCGRNLKSTLAELHDIGEEELRAEGFKKRDIQSMDFVDLRYRGQSYELTVTLAPDFIERFHQAHERRYGYANRGRQVELVNVRTTFLGRTIKSDFKHFPKQRGRPSPVDTQPVWIDHKRIKTRPAGRGVRTRSTACPWTTGRPPRPTHRGGGRPRVT